jgi:hypothetical protein
MDPTMGMVVVGRWLMVHVCQYLKQWGTLSMQLDKWTFVCCQPTLLVNLSFCHNQMFSVNCFARRFFST